MRVALVTGSGRGIGRATAELFAAKGFRVVVCARSEAEVQAAAAAITAQFGADRALALRLDLRDPASIEALFDQVEQTWGPVEVLVNNGAIGVAEDFLSMSVEDFDRVQEINVRGVFLCSQRMIRALAREKKPGVIINLSSLGGIQGTEKFKGLSAYTTSKAAVIGLTEVLAVEGREYGVRVNAVAPGAVDTEMLRKAAPHLKTNTGPEDVAQVIVSLVEEAEKAGVTGKVIEIHSNIQ